MTTKTNALFALSSVLFLVSLAAVAEDVRNVRAPRTPPSPITVPGSDPVPLRDWPVIVQTVKHMPQNAVIGSGPAANKGAGFVGATDGVPSPSSNFIAIAPCRVVDTRTAMDGPKLVGDEIPGRTFFIPSGPCPGIQVTAIAFSLNLTVFAPERPGYLTAFPWAPGGAVPPGVSNVNYNAGETVANSAIVPAGPTGGITIFTSANAHVIIDINGFFTEGGAVHHIPYHGGVGTAVPSLEYALFQTVGIFGKVNGGTAITATWQSHIRTNGPADTFCEFELRIDNARADGFLPWGHGGAVLFSLPGGENSQQVSYTARWTGLPAGGHTVSMWFRGSASFCTDNYGDFEARVDIAEE